MPRLSVLIPVYNELETIERVLERVSAARVENDIEIEIVVVDDGSTDGTREKLRALQNQGEPRFSYIEHESNRGKGGGHPNRVRRFHRRHCAHSGCRS